MRIVKTSMFFLALLLPGLALAAPAASTHATAAAKTSMNTASLADLEAPKANKTYTVGTLRVQQYGNHGRPLILIPGLEGGSWVWRDTIGNFRSDHVIYAVTLAGFDGIPAPKGGGSLFDRGDASLLKLIKSRHIEKPVLIGHSLGGTLSIRFAEQHSKLLSGVIAVDGLPILPGMERVSAKQRKVYAAQAEARIAKATPEQFHQGVIAFMVRRDMLDAARAKRYAALNARSDQAASAKYFGEDMAADYRPGLKNIGVPLLEISPYNAPDFSKPPLVMTGEQKTKYYESLLAGAPHAKVVSISPARHFVMFDQPKQFQAALTTFLVGLAKK
ncbi:MAG: alpha/beta fold hydrolase [Gammaproteobacteria bacterium]